MSIRVLIGNHCSDEKIREKAFEELRELERLAEIGRATELAYEKGLKLDYVGVDILYDVDELIGWYQLIMENEANKLG